MYEPLTGPAADWSKMRPIFDQVCQPMLLVDRLTQNIVDANVAACDALAMVREQLIGQRWSAVSAELGTTSSHELDERWLVIIGQGVVTDQAIAPSDSQRDALTGLASREALWARGELAVGAPRESASAGRRALLFIDLDGFKQVNDTWGHVWGDRVLRALAERLSDCVRPGDLVVRYGGDEFVVLVEGVRRQRDLERLARRICRSIERPLMVERHEVAVSASIGIARSKRRDQSIEELVAEADRAMYRAKSERQAQGRLQDGSALEGALSAR